VLDGTITEADGGLVGKPVRDVLQRDRAGALFGRAESSFDGEHVAISTRLVKQAA